MMLHESLGRKIVIETLKYECSINTELHFDLGVIYIFIYTFFFPYHNMVFWFSYCQELCGI